MRRLLDLAVAAAVMGAVACGPAGNTGDGGTDGGALDAGPEVCVNFPEQLTVDTVIAKGCYLVLQTPTISAAVKLTLSPGTKLVFSQGTALEFEAEQVLEAVGTEAEPILLTGSVKTRGHWLGLRFWGTSTPSTLDWVTLEYAGDTEHDTNSAGLKLEADSRGVRLAMSHTTLRENAGWGLYAVGSALITNFRDNTLTKNGLGPASLDSQVVGVTDPSSHFSGNDVDRLHVRAYRMTVPSVWGALDVPYYLDGTLSLTTAELTIAAGATLVFAQGGGIDVSGDAAGLIAEGTATAPILFTGEAKSRGAWSGLYFDGSRNPHNSLKHAIVEWAGDVAADTDNAAVKCRADSHGVLLKLDHVTLRQSKGWGLYLAGSAEIGTFSNNTITQNELGPVWLDANVGHVLDTTSTYAGNDVDKVYVQAYRINGAVTWHDLGVPWLIDGVLWPSAVLTLEPGVTFEMAEGAQVNVSGDLGGLHAVGTAAKPITFTGATKTAGSWLGLDFDGSMNPDNVLQYCVVEYGGGGAAAGWGGMIYAHSDSHGVRLQVKDSIVRYSALWGIWLGRYAQSTLSGNTVSNNASGDVYQQP